jgi:16S rRNA (guanine(966)-N(2))-methyltransferase RsmD
VRVIAGAARGTRLRSPSFSGTRPITDRGKEALFGILAPRLAGTRYLDLFAGTGAVGIEALSRGARHATFVERNDLALGDLAWNLHRTRLAAHATVVKDDVFSFLRRRGTAQFDVVWLAPPQWHGLWEKTMAALEDAPEWVAPDGVLIAHCDPKEVHDMELASFERYDVRRYGNVALMFHRRRDSTCRSGEPPIL